MVTTYVLLGLYAALCGIVIWAKVDERRRAHQDDRRDADFHAELDRLDCRRAA